MAYTETNWLSLILKHNKNHYKHDEPAYRWSNGSLFLSTDSFTSGFYRQSGPNYLTDVDGENITDVDGTALEGV